MRELRKTIRSVLRSPLSLRAKWRDHRLASKPHHELAVCAIFREEAPFLDEWLKFHLGIGVTRFYLYNNFSTDNFHEVLAPYIASGVVSLTTWPKPIGQLSAYSHCIRQRANEARWLAFFDIDEYLFSPERMDIRPILEEYVSLPGVIVYSPYFGSSGFEHRPPGRLVETLTKRSTLDFRSAKTIVNPRQILRAGVHAPKVLRGECLDTSFQKVTHLSVPVLDRLRINHYWSRSLSDLRKKVARGDASTASPRVMSEHLKIESRLNAEDDFSILPVSKAVFREEKPAPQSCLHRHLLVNGDS